MRYIKPFILFAVLSCTPFVHAGLCTQMFNATHHSYTLSGSFKDYWGNTNSVTGTIKSTGSYSHGAIAVAGKINIKNKSGVIVDTYLLSKSVCWDNGYNVYGGLDLYWNPTPLPQLYGVSYHYSPASTNFWGEVTYNPHQPAERLNFSLSILSRHEQDRN